jgi:hypothetical protein
MVAVVAVLGLQVLPLAVLVAAGTVIITRLLRVLRVRRILVAVAAVGQRLLPIMVMRVVAG